MVSFHRHGVLDETRVDGYVVRLEGIDPTGNGDEAINLVFRAPIGVPTMSISTKLLSEKYKYRDAIENFDLLREICKDAQKSLLKDGTEHP